MPNEISMLVKIKQKLTKFEKRAKKIQQTLKPICDYSTIHNYVIVKELDSEIKKLRALVQAAEHGEMTLDEFTNQFKAHCQQRVATNRDTALSYNTLPNGDTNRLYWEILNLLFAPKNFYEFLRILFPNIQTILQPYIETDIPLNVSKKASIQDKRETMRSIELDLVEMPIRSEKDEPIPPNLADYHFDDTQILDVSKLAKCTFEQHLQLYDLLGQYPDLRDRLYQRNAMLRVLKADIELIRNNGQTPRQALAQMTKEFVLGSTKVTGQDEASQSAKDAYVAFHQYLHALRTSSDPKAQKLEEAILSLRTSGGITLNEILKKLSDEDCVETASQKIYTILQNPKYQNILDSSPGLSSKQLENIKDKYKSKNRMAWVAAYHNLPEILTAEALRQIKIDTAEELICLFTDFNLELFDPLLKNISIDASKQVMIFTLLFHAIKYLCFNEAQLASLVPAIAKNIDRFFPKSQVLPAVIASNNAQLVELVLKDIKTEDLLKIIQEKDESGKTLLHYAINEPESLRVILKSLLKAYPKERLLSVLEDDEHLYFHWATKMPQSFKLFMDLYLEPEARIAIGNKNDHNGETVLQKLLKAPESLQIFLSSLPQNDCETLAREKDSEGKYWLEKSLNTPDSFRALFYSISEPQRHQIILKRDNKGIALIHRASHPENLKTIFLATDATNHHQYMETKTNFGETILHGAVDFPATIKIGLEVYPTSKMRLAAVCYKNQIGETVIHQAKDVPETIEIILNALDEADGLTALKIRNGIGDTVLHAALPYKLSVEKILTSIHENNQLDLLLQTNTQGKTVLHAAADYPQSLKIIFALLPEQSILDALKYRSRPKAKPLWKSCLDKLIYQVESPLINCLSAVALINYRHQQKNKSNDRFFSEGRSIPTLKLPALFEKHTPSDIYETVLAFLSTGKGGFASDYQKDLLNELVSKYDAQTPTSYENQLHFLKQQWEDLINTVSLTETTGARFLNGSA